MEDRSIISINSLGGPISVTIAVSKFPKNIAGVVWRYNADTSFDVKVGIFTIITSENSLGVPSVVNDKIFLVEGAILHHNDIQVAPYQVIVSVMQENKVLQTEVPPIKAYGKFKNEDVSFIYHFQLKVG